ncbi:uncharacterized protein VICG_02092 [Vittaforma corneae ATCC 50505]|uniref:Uncharacterized protein n=1 Tax=Vittaforma corneae (strain ATCC 50505) TaxID=993615 RepID=L2GJQ7_VITCO|nr:uncharacterized protein VICG_02092 [Vittaforma corneae ATCC 50505]ELA40869.1 hypothetical protein VICG_02092 [Vittaforma corneae ATCC 50505]
MLDKWIVVRIHTLVYLSISNGICEICKYINVLGNGTAVSCLVNLNQNLLPTTRHSNNKNGLLPVFIKLCFTPFASKPSKQWALHRLLRNRRDTTQLTINNINTMLKKDSGMPFISH